jgi:hypothetical protein
MNNTIYSKIQNKTRKNNRNTTNITKSNNSNKNYKINNTNYKINNTNYKNNNKNYKNNNKNYKIDNKIYKNNNNKNNKTNKATNHLKNNKNNKKRILIGGDGPGEIEHPGIIGPALKFIATIGKKSIAFTADRLAQVMNIEIDSGKQSVNEILSEFN